MPRCPPRFVLNSQAPGEGLAVRAVFLLGSSAHKGAAEPLAGEMGSLQNLHSLPVMSGAWHQGRHQAEMQSGCWYTAEKFYALKYTF